MVNVAKKAPRLITKNFPSVRINIRAVLCDCAACLSYLDPAMHRSAKRSRKAAKPHGETGPAQKAFATVGSAVRDGASTGLLSANLNVAPILFFTALPGGASRTPVAEGGGALWKARRSISPREKKRREKAVWAVRRDEAAPLDGVCRSQ